MPKLTSHRPISCRPALALAVALLFCSRLPAQISPAGGNPANPPLPTLAPVNRPVSVPANAPAPAPASATGPDIHDLHSLVPLTFWERHGTEIIISSILAVAVIALILWLLFRKKPVVSLTPYQLALQELEFARGLRDTGQDKIFAISASDAVRRYLENAYQMPAPERTTEEFLQVVTNHVWLQGELTALLRRFLEFCDLAKFAGQQFGAEEREQLLNAAREFIETAEKLRQPATTSASASAMAPAVKAQPTLTAP